MSLVPRSTRNKLKLAFYATLMVLVVSIPSYIYVYSLVPKAATFESNNLRFDQSWVQFGTPIEISVDITNVGDKNGNHSVILRVDDEVINTKTVQLLPSETKTVLFTATGLEVGNHTVGVGDLIKSIMVTEEVPTKPAELDLSNLGISRTQAGIGDPVTVSVTATNIGDLKGSFSLDVFVNNQKTQTKTLALEGKESTIVYFEVGQSHEGEYIISLGDLSPVSLSVTSDADPVQPAEFRVSNLVVSPSSALADEVVQVSIRLSNVGEESGRYDAILYIDGVLSQTKSVTLPGGATTTVVFDITQTNQGTYNVAIEQLTETFSITSSAEASEYIEIGSLSVSPYEVTAGDVVSIKFKADNLVNEQSALQTRLLLDGEIKATEPFLLEAGAKDVVIEFSYIAEYTGSENKLDGYRVEVVNLGNQSNSLSGYFQVAPDGYHTLSISSNGIGMEFTINGEIKTSPYLELLPEGSYIIEVPDGYEGGGTWWNWTRWIDGPDNRIRTINLNSRISLTANYLNCKSCPSLYVWDGVDYVYTAEISDGTGYLGIFDYFREDGSLAFLYSVPWDYTKLNASRIQPKDGYYDMTLTQNWDEIAYVDFVSLWVVEHSADVDVYSTKATYLYELEEQGIIYTVDKKPNNPVSCINSTRHDLLPLVLERDGITTQGNEFLWDTLELDLGDLSNAEEIKLIVAGTIVYSSGEDQGEWAGQFYNRPGEKPFPPPYMEVKDSEGNWVPVAENKQFPLLDVTPDCFVVNLTGLFLSDDYSIRIHTFFNTQIDYIGVDTSVQKDLIIREVPVSSALLSQAFKTNSTSSGNFTRYGNVTDLVLTPNDEFVIIRQGDQINILFPEETGLVDEGMERDYFVVASVWFKVDGLFYVDFTVDPLPFHNMTCFPYSASEEYPDGHQNYLEEYNTRIIQFSQ